MKLTVHFDGVDVQIPWTEYIPKTPHTKQLAVLLLDDYKEVLYGGAARGGKTELLLMACLQFVDVPGYSAIIFRKQLTDFFNSEDAIGPRLEGWLGGTPARWNGQTHKWTFPTSGRPSSLEYGYIGKDYQVGMTKYRYQGSRYQTICWDELTQQHPDDYGYMFSRLDRPNCEKHRPGGKGQWAPDCEQCRDSRLLQAVPMRVRSATNPGGFGHKWVKKHFRMKKTGNLWLGENANAPFIPAFVQDNPAVDQDNYIDNLRHIADRTTRRQLLKGDWDESQDSRFKLNDFPRYRVEVIAGAKHFVCANQRVAWTRCRWFATVDVAASSREGPADSLLYVRRDPSWTVVSVWALTPACDLILVYVYRKQCEVPEIITTMREAHTQWRLEFVAQEVDGLGIGVYQIAQRSGLPMLPVNSEGRDKLARANDAMVRSENGKIWIPEHAGWLEAWEEEVEAWTGDERMQADQIDTMSHAAILVSRQTAGSGLFAGTTDYRTLLEVVR